MNDSRSKPLMVESSGEPLASFSNTSIVLAALEMLPSQCRLFC